MKLKLCEIVQQLDYIKIEEVEKVLIEKTCIRDYAYIIHNRDKYDNGELKAPHVHIALRFNNAYDTKHVAQWFNITENYISKVKGKWSDMLKYLTHKNAEGKFQYSDNEVISNFDFKSIIEKSDSKKNKDFRREEIINKIAEGEIREYNYHSYISAVEFSTFSKAINDAFKYRVEKLLSEGNDKKMECIFLTGLSGTGKTTYAKKIANDKNYSYFISSSTNDIMDGYKGQDVLILDDLRPSSMQLVDLIKMLDNNTSSTVKSRFKNKFLECKLIIITTVLEIEDFYRCLEGYENEPVEQFKRRCKTYVRLDNDYMYIRSFDTKIMNYGKTYRLDNPVIEYIQCSQKSDEEMFMDMVDVLGIDVDKLK